MPVSRFNRLSSALAASAPTPLRSPDGCPALVPTERVIEAERMVKDAGEVATLREAGRRLGGAAGRGRSLARPGRSEIEVAGDIDAMLRRVGLRAAGVRDDRRLGARTAPCRTRARPPSARERATGWCWTLAGSTTDTAWI